MSEASEVESEEPSGSDTPLGGNRPVDIPEPKARVIFNDEIIEGIGDILEEDGFEARVDTRHWMEDDPDYDPNELSADGVTLLWYTEDGERVMGRDRALRRFYGITQAQYDAILAHQGGVCAICKKPPKKSENLSVDHDHDSLVIRGLLHRIPCNRRLTQAVSNYVLNPPAQEVASFVIPPKRVETLEGRRVRKAAGRSTRRKEAKEAAKIEAVKTAAATISLAEKKRRVREQQLEAHGKKGTP